MGFMSGEHAGCSRTSISASLRKLLTVAATCGRALSCIRMNPSPINGRKGMTIGSKMSVMYRSAFKDPPSTTCRTVRPPRQMPPHTMIEPPPNSIVPTMLHCAYRSPGRLST
uniref:Uncharacterized protein n=1 Tax=Cacopsylla melanoneura TaxID=428564 RepID=A0A8D8RL78_9HEMI